ncbi:Tripartite tricarboxylate transporter TctB family, partial [Dysosmobacter welbionis]
NAPGDALVFLADERGRVDSDDPRRALPDGIVVRQFLLCGPVLVLHHFPLENRQHRHAAAEGHDPHLREGPKQCPKLFQPYLPLSLTLYIRTGPGRTPRRTARSSPRRPASAPPGRIPHRCPMPPPSRRLRPGAAAARSGPDSRTAAGTRPDKDQSLLPPGLRRGGP